MYYSIIYAHILTKGIMLFYIRRQYDCDILQMLEMILDGCKDLDEAKEKNKGIEKGKACRIIDRHTRKRAGLPPLFFYYTELFFRLQ